MEEELIKIEKDGKGLYDYVAKNYWKMSKEELKNICLNAIYVADDEKKIIDYVLDY